MSSPEPSPFANTLLHRRAPLVAAALLVALVLAAWSGSFGGPFVLDDLSAVVSNNSIRDLTDLGAVLSPPAEASTTGRLVLNLTYAINYFIGRLDVGGYHGVNLVLHAAATLVLFGLVRRSLLLPMAGERFRNHALLLAFTVAILWALHPVQTASVTYISQRAESLLGLFYLFTLYAFVRAVEPFASAEAHAAVAASAVRAVDTDDYDAGSDGDRAEAPPAPSASAQFLEAIADTTVGNDAIAPPAKPPYWRDNSTLAWSVAAIVACLLGMGTAQTMVTAPLMVLLFDRTFVAGSFLAALRARPRLYVGLALTWTLAFLALADVSARSLALSQGLDRVTYLYTQARGLWHYLALAFWPEPLVFAYDGGFVRSLGLASLYALPLLLVVGAVGFALIRAPRLGFVAAWFFIVLAPPASAVPIADHRLYLPLAGLATGLVLLAHACIGRRTVAAVLTVALAAGLLTFTRNRVYQNALNLWADTVVKQPTSIAARVQLADLLSRIGRNADAVAQLRRALQLDPNHASAHNNLANALISVGRTDEAILHYRAAIHLQPEASLVRANFGYILLQAGRLQEAEVQCRLAVKQNPYNASAHLNLALVYEAAGRPDLEIVSLQNALILNPTYFEAHFNLGLALLRVNRPADAIPRFEAAVQLRPAMIEPHLGLVRALLFAGRPADASQRALFVAQRAPNSPEAWFLLGNALALTGDLPNAAAAYERALTLKPDYPAARDNLTRVRAQQSGQTTDQGRGTKD